MKRISISLLVFFVSVALSACAGKTSTNKKNISSGNGGIYKSSDGGETFSAINKISETNNLSQESITNIVFDSNNSETIYLGTQNSGIYRSDNGGKSWAKNKSEFSYVGKIELDPTDENIIYIIAKYQGEIALLKTTDKGINWKRLLLQRDQNQPIILDVLVDKNNHQTVYATDSTNGIYKSIDGGREWKSIYWGEFPVGGILMDSQDSNILYFVTKHQQVYVTSDGGKTFKVRKTDKPIHFVNVSQTQRGVLYILLQGGLYVSKDAGKTVELIPTLLKPEVAMANMIISDPIDQNTLYLIAGKVIYKTENAGKTWRSIPLKTKWLVSQFKINPGNNKQIYLGNKKPVKKRGLGLPFIKF